MPITQEEYDFVAAAADYSGALWGIIDDEGRLHMCLFCALFVQKGMQLEERNHPTTGQKIIIPVHGPVWEVLYFRLLEEMGVSQYQYNKQLREGGVAGVLPLFKKLVKENAKET